MTPHTRFIAAVVVAGTALGGLVLAQGAAAPPAQGQPPAAGQAPAPAGRGAAPAGRQGGAQGGGARRGGFTQFTRELASQDVLVRGKSLYEAQCASCHMSDLRGGSGPNLLRSGVALADQHGELVGAAVAKHTPALTPVQADVVAIAEYMHSIHATMGGQGSPPGRGAASSELNVLVGDAKAGEAQFATLCASCHSVSGNLKGIGSKFADARALQNGWVSGSSATFGGGGGRGGAAGGAATVTMADGSKLEGTLVRKDDFLVVITLPDGTRKSIARNNGIPKVDVKDPNEAHKSMAMKLIFDDPDNKKMHDITAYLWSIK
jgi:cytochrome c oxidase cbb3-type subunit 3